MRKSKTKGFEDVEGVLEHLDSEHKRHQREEWIRQHYTKKPKIKPPKEGGSNESNSKPRYTS